MQVGVNGKECERIPRNRKQEIENRKQETGKEMQRKVKRKR